MTSKLHRSSIRTSVDRIKTLQKDLPTLGFEIKDRAGTVGPTTRAAVMQFQTNQGIHATGSVDEKTAGLLRSLPRRCGSRRKSPENWRRLPAESSRKRR